MEDQIVRELQKAMQTAHHADTYTGLTGRLDDDGNVEADPRAELPNNRIWVRPDGSDDAVDVWCIKVRTDKANLPVTVERMADGEWQVKELMPSKADIALGPAASTFNQPDIAGDLLRTVIPSENLQPGRVRIVSGMTVYIGEFHFQMDDGTDAFWPGGELDLTANIPATADTKAVVLIGVDATVDPLEATAFTGDEVPATFPPTQSPYMTGTDAATAVNAAGPGYAWTRWVTLFEGQTALTSTDDFKSLWQAVKLPEAAPTGILFPQRAMMWHPSARVTVGNALALAANAGGGQWYPAFFQSASADGDTFTHSFFILAGTYTFEVVGDTTSSSGKVDWYVDNVKEVSLQDWYSVTSPTRNVKKTASITIATSGYHQLKGVINTKNASSGGFDLWLEYYHFYPAAD